MSSRRVVPMLRLRQSLYRRVPALPMSEALDRIVQWPAMRRSGTREALDVRAVAADLHETPSAKVVTVIATYRRSALAERAVRSALEQTVRDHLVILVDDGGGQLPSFEHPRLRKVSLPANSGVVGYVRNVGMAVTASQYVAFLDDDNVWKPEHLALALDRLEAGAALAYSGFELVDASGQVLALRTRAFDRRALAHANYIDASTIVARRSPHIRFSPLRRRRGSHRMEDWELVWRVSAHQSVAHVPACTVQYLDNEHSYFSELQGPQD